MDSATDPYFSAQPAGMDLDGGMAPAPLSFTEVKPYPACPTFKQFAPFPSLPPPPPIPSHGSSWLCRRDTPAGTCCGRITRPPSKPRPNGPRPKIWPIFGAWDKLCFPGIRLLPPRAPSMDIRHAADCGMAILKCPGRRGRVQ